MVIATAALFTILRYLASPDDVDRLVFSQVLAMTGIGLFILIIVVAFNLLFIRSVIAPVSEITRVSKRIAEGSYGVQINNTYKDEIGEMVSSINEMSLKIAQSEKIQKEFISSISHELRTPLTAITGWGETLIYNEDLDDQSKRGIYIILKEARRLTKMVEELLEFTRIEDGRFTLNIEMIDIAAELEDAIFMFRELLHQDELEFEYHSDLSDSMYIPGDPNRLKQVFLNLFDNAAKYGRDGKRIRVVVTSEDDYVKVTIRDFGSGVPVDELDNVKMKFYKGSNAKDRGSGIGLAVCEEIVKYHGGSMELNNADDGGFLVTIILPTNSLITER
jgi:signal transduction histidine kinase